MKPHLNDLRCVVWQDSESPMGWATHVERYYGLDAGWQSVWASMLNPDEEAARTKGMAELERRRRSAKTRTVYS